jgi:TolB-like protein/thioredoxin-like negative regulator of GroEL
MSLFAELKRRNVFRVAAAYILIGWLVMQIGEVMAPALHLPEWIVSALAFFVILGFPFAMFFAWAFEMTPEGLKREKDVRRDQSVTPVTGRKLDFAIIGLLVLALGYFAFDRFVLAPGRDKARIDAAMETARQQAAASEPAVANASIAVLPFVNMSSDPEQEYFSDGLSEELLNLLARIPNLQVAARTSSFSFKGQNLEIREIAQKLGVAHVLEGSVRKSGKQLRITAQLIQADNGFHLWSETWDRNLDNIFAIQDEIAANVVEALKVTLLGEVPSARETDPQAYQLFLQAQYFARQRSAASLQRAVELYQQAVAIDARYAPAWAELAYAYLWLAASGGMPIDEGNALADQAVQTALDIDPDYGWAHMVHASSLVINKFRFREGQAVYKRAHELDPGNAMLRQALAFGGSLFGLFDEAVTHQLSAIALDPVMPELRQNLGWMYWSMGRYEQAIPEFQQVLQLSPDYPNAHGRLARVYLGQGRIEEALDEAGQEQVPVYRLTALAMVQFKRAEQAASDRALEELTRDWSGDAAFQIAEVHAARGQVDEAFHWLEQCLVIRDSGLANILGDPVFVSLFDDPRWPELLARLELLEAWQAMPPEWGGPQP